MADDQRTAHRLPWHDPGSWPDWLVNGLYVATLIALIVVTTIRSLSN